MTEPNAPRRPTSTSTSSTDAPSYFTSQSLRRPSSLRQSSTPSPQAGQASTSIPPTSNTQLPPPLPEESTIRPRPFAPLFTLVTDNTGSRAPRTHHPRVHYIFTDDDDDALAAALESHSLNTMAASPETGSAASLRSGRHSGHKERDRAIVLDLVPKEGEAGYDVKYASSLGSDWAVTGATIGRMKGEGPAGGDGEEDGVMVLRIEGVGVGPPVLSGRPTSGAFGAGAQADVEGRGESSGEASEFTPHIDEFEKRMVVLKKVVGALDERQRDMAEREREREREEHGDESREGQRPPWDEGDAVETEVAD